MFSFRRASLPYGFMIGLTVGLLLLFGFLWLPSAFSNSNAAENSASVAQDYKRKLNRGDVLTITRDGCNLEIAPHPTNARVLVACNPAGAPAVAAPKTTFTLVLHVNDRVTVSSNACALVVADSSLAKITIKCVRFPPPPTPSPVPTVTPDPQTDAHAVAVASGLAHTCALSESERVRCWGSNASGQLGTGDFQDSSVPVLVKGLPYSWSGFPYAVIAIRTGDAHTCALVENGQVYCWGENKYGQLGDGTATNRNLPVLVRNVNHAIALTAGAAHTCVLTETHAVKCWGRNNYGQLGDGTTKRRAVPVKVSDLSRTVMGLAAGANHTCARLSGGRVKCWGLNQDGELGDGTTTNRLTPVVVSTLSDIVSIAAGGQHSCAVTRDFYAKCWGRNQNGELGDGTTTNAKLPVDICANAACNGTPLYVVKLSLGLQHTCALTTSENVLCWGNNSAGQLGDGDTAPSLTPRNVCANSACVSPISYIQPLFGIPAVAAGGEHSCAANKQGRLVCWGSNVHGELGDGTMQNSFVPVGVVGFGK